MTGRISMSAAMSAVPSGTGPTSPPRGSLHSKNSKSETLPIPASSPIQRNLSRTPPPSQSGGNNASSATADQTSHSHATTPIPSLKNGGTNGPFNGDKTNESISSSSPKSKAGAFSRISQSEANVLRSQVQDLVKSRYRAFDYQFKVCVLGAPGVGKSSIVRTLTGLINRDDFDTYAPTHGAEFAHWDVNIGRRKMVRLSIWDCSGNEMYENMVSTWLYDAVTAIIVYDVANKESFVKATKMAEEISQMTVTTHVNIILVANKIDIPKFRIVSTTVTASQKTIKSEPDSSDDFSYDPTEVVSSSLHSINSPSAASPKEDPLDSPMLQEGKNDHSHPTSSSMSSAHVLKDDLYQVVKSIIPRGRIVRVSEGVRFARRNGVKYFEVSAKTAKHVISLFHHIARHCLLEQFHRAQFDRLAQNDYSSRIVKSKDSKKEGLWKGKGSSLMSLSLTTSAQPLVIKTQRKRRKSSVSSPNANFRIMNSIFQLGRNSSQASTAKRLAIRLYQGQSDALGALKFQSSLASRITPNRRLSVSGRRRRSSVTAKRKGSLSSPPLTPMAYPTSPLSSPTSPTVSGRRFSTTKQDSLSFDRESSDFLIVSHDPLDAPEDNTSEREHSMSVPEMADEDRYITKGTCLVEEELVRASMIGAVEDGQESEEDYDPEDFTDSDDDLTNPENELNLDESSGDSNADSWSDLDEYPGSRVNTAFETFADGNSIGVFGGEGLNTPFSFSGESLRDSANGDYVDATEEMKAYEEQSSDKINGVRIHNFSDDGNYNQSNATEGDLDQANFEGSRGYGLLSTQTSYNTEADEAANYVQTEDPVSLERRENFDYTLKKNDEYKSVHSVDRSFEDFSAQSQTGTQTFVPSDSVSDVVEVIRAEFEYSSKTEQHQQPSNVSHSPDVHAEIAIASEEQLDSERLDNFTVPTKTSAFPQVQVPGTLEDASSKRPKKGITEGKGKFEKGKTVDGESASVRRQAIKLPVIEEQKSLPIDLSDDFIIGDVSLGIDQVKEEGNDTNVNTQGSEFVLEEAKVTKPSTGLAFSTSLSSSSSSPSAPYILHSTEAKDIVSAETTSRITKNADSNAETHGIEMTRLVEKVEEGGHDSDHSAQGRKQLVQGRNAPLRRSFSRRKSENFGSSVILHQNPNEGRTTNDMHDASHTIISQKARGRALYVTSRAPVGIIISIVYLLIIGIPGYLYKYLLPKSHVEFMARDIVNAFEIEPENRRHRFLIRKQKILLYSIPFLFVLYAWPSVCTFAIVSGEKITPEQVESAMGTGLLVLSSFLVLTCVMAIRYSKLYGASSESTRLSIREMYIKAVSELERTFETPRVNYGASFAPQGGLRRTIASPYVLSARSISSAAFGSPPAGGTMTPYRLMNSNVPNSNSVKSVTDNAGFAHLIIPRDSHTIEGQTHEGPSLSYASEGADKSGASSVGYSRGKEVESVGNDIQQSTGTLNNAVISPIDGLIENKPESVSNLSEKGRLAKDVFTEQHLVENPELTELVPELRIALHQRHDQMRHIQEVYYLAAERDPNTSDFIAPQLSIFRDSVFHNYLRGLSSELVNIKHGAVAVAARHVSQDINFIVGGFDETYSVAQSEHIPFTPYGKHADDPRNSLLDIVNGPVLLPPRESSEPLITYSTEMPPHFDKLHASEEKSHAHAFANATHGHDSTPIMSNSALARTRSYNVSLVGQLHNSAADGIVQAHSSRNNSPILRPLPSGGKLLTSPGTGSNHFASRVANGSTFVDNTPVFPVRSSASVGGDESGSEHGKANEEYPARSSYHNPSYSRAYSHLNALAYPLTSSDAHFIFHNSPQQETYDAIRQPVGEPFDVVGLKHARESLAYGVRYPRAQWKWFWRCCYKDDHLVEFDARNQYLKDLKSPTAGAAGGAGVPQTQVESPRKWAAWPGSAAGPGVWVTLLMAVELLQWLFLPLGVHAPYWTRKVHRALFLIDNSHIMSGISMALVGLMIIVIALQFYIDIAQFMYTKDSRRANQRLFFTLGGSLLFGHVRIDRIAPGVRRALFFICDSCFLLIAFHLLNSISCTNYPHAAYDYLDPDVSCWPSISKWRGIVALIAVQIYLLVSVVLVPNIVLAGGLLRQERFKKSSKAAIFRFITQYIKCMHPLYNHSSNPPAHTRAISYRGDEGTSSYFTLFGVTENHGETAINIGSTNLDSILAYQHENIKNDWHLNASDIVGVTFHHKYLMLQYSIKCLLLTGYVVIFREYRLGELFLMIGSFSLALVTIIWMKYPQTVRASHFKDDSPVHSDQDKSSKPRTGSIASLSLGVGMPHSHQSQTSPQLSPMDTETLREVTKELKDHIQKSEQQTQRYMPSSSRLVDYFKISTFLLGGWSAFTSVVLTDRTGRYNGPEDQWLIIWLIGIAGVICSLTIAFHRRSIRLWISNRGGLKKVISSAFSCLCRCNKDEPRIQSPQQSSTHENVEGEGDTDSTSNANITYFENGEVEEEDSKSYCCFWISRAPKKDRVLEFGMARPLPSRAHREEETTTDNLETSEEKLEALPSPQTADSRTIPAVKNLEMLEMTTMNNPQSSLSSDGVQSTALSPSLGSSNVQPVESGGASSKGGDETAQSASDTQASSETSSAVVLHARPSVLQSMTSQQTILLRNKSGGQSKLDGYGYTLVPPKLPVQPSSSIRRPHSSMYSDLDEDDVPTVRGFDEDMVSLLDNVSSIEQSLNVITQKLSDRRLVNSLESLGYAQSARGSHDLTHAKDTLSLGTGRLKKSKELFGFSSQIYQKHSNGGASGGSSSSQASSNANTTNDFTSFLSDANVRLARVLADETECSQLIKQLMLYEEQDAQARVSRLQENESALAQSKSRLSIYADDRAEILTRANRYLLHLRQGEIMRNSILRKSRLVGPIRYLLPKNFKKFLSDESLVAKVMPMFEVSEEVSVMVYTHNDKVEGKGNESQSDAIRNSKPKPNSSAITATTTTTSTLTAATSYSHLSSASNASMRSNVQDLGLMGTEQLFKLLPGFRVPPTGSRFVSVARHTRIEDYTCCEWCDTYYELQRLDNLHIDLVFGLPQSFQHPSIRNLKRRKRK